MNGVFVRLVCVSALNLLATHRKRRLDELADVVVAGFQVAVLHRLGTIRPAALQAGLASWSRHGVQEPAAAISAPGEIRPGSPVYRIWAADQNRAVDGLDRGVALAALGAGVGAARAVGGVRPVRAAVRSAGQEPALPADWKSSFSGAWIEKRSSGRRPTSCWMRRPGPHFPTIAVRGARTGHILAVPRPGRDPAIDIDPHGYRRSECTSWTTPSCRPGRPSGIDVRLHPPASRQ